MRRLTRIYRSKLGLQHEMRRIVELTFRNFSGNVLPGYNARFGMPDRKKTPARWGVFFADSSGAPAVAKMPVKRDIGTISPAVVPNDPHRKPVIC